MAQPAANRSRFIFTAGGVEFSVVRFKAEEGISRLYSVRLELASQEDIPLESVIGCSGLLTMLDEDGDRFFHGSVHAFFQSGVRGRFQLYTAVLMPQAALLDHRQDCRIFQDLAVPQIVTQVLQDAGVTADLFTFRLQGSYPQREYCVQYRERDLDFIRRLLAEEGIFFYFEHGRDNHRMVFGDSTANYQPIAGNARIPMNPGAAIVAEQEAVIAFRRGLRMFSGKYAQRDFNFEKPALDLTTCSQAKENRELQIYDYPGLYTLPEQGRRLTQVRLEQAGMNKDQAHGKSVVARFLPGFTFSLTGAGFDGLDADYLLVALTHQGEQPQVLAERSEYAKGTSYVNAFTAVPAEVTIRPSREGLQKPLVPGAQTAIVTGPAGEEIYTDRYGRVKVQFHWDRQGRRNAQSSCWIRVSQGWAGAGWGAMYIPRIGQEVVVDFLEGDPDRPIITGRAYHGENLPPCDLPAQKTVSTLKSLSSLGGEGLNEIRVEDKKGDEQLFMHAEKNMDQRVKNEQRFFVGHEAHHLVQKDQYVQVDQARHQTTHGDRIEQVDGKQMLTIGADRQVKVGGNHGLQAGQKIDFNALSAAVVQAGAALTLKVGPSAVTIDAAGVSIIGTKVSLNQGGTALSGRGVFIQSPASPQEADNARPGHVETNPAIAPQPEESQPSEAQPKRIVPIAAAPAPDETDWIEVQLLDGEGSPMPGQQFYITAVNGKQYSGVTNAEGIGHIDHLKTGNCRIDFAKLDKDLWGPQGSPDIGRVSQRSAGTKPHEVKPGDTLAAIAEKHNIHWRLIWDHPDNAELKQKRQEPYVLMNGDIINLPELEPKQEQGATSQRHVFQTAGEPLAESILRIDYQIDVETPEAHDDSIRLIHKESDWTQSIAVKNLTEFDADWVAMRFENVPRAGTFDLVYDTNEDEELHYLLADCSYEQLCTPDDQAEAVKTAEDNEAETG